ncbi:hypothetical protein [Helicobacter bizzozeronii]|uniref:hypothetical protein n=1 Tax=Helicobacter bizzozeronii TaxID=56877 RepID=UPI00131519FB|nr:hypothetical protein [Helicobacter bizzozeronii]
MAILKRGLSLKFAGLRLCAPQPHASASRPGDQEITLPTCAMLTYASAPPV